MGHTIFFSHLYKFICYRYLSFRFFPTDNIKIIIITGMAYFLSFANFPSQFSWKNFSFNIIFIKVCYCIPMAFIGFSTHRMNSIDGMKNSIISSVICSLIFLCRQQYSCRFQVRLSSLKPIERKIFSRANFFFTLLHTKRPPLYEYSHKTDNYQPIF